MFEEYNSLYVTYNKFYIASEALKRRGVVLTYGSTVSSGFLLFVVGSIITTGSPAWAESFGFGLSVIVAGLSFLNAVDNPHEKSNVCYNSGQTLQELYLEFGQMITIRLPDSDECLDELESDCETLIDRKNTVNETTPQLGDKWYRRVKKQRNTNWEPKPLNEITGEDGEFEKEPDDTETNSDSSSFRKIKTTLISIIYWFGY